VSFAFLVAATLRRQFFPLRSADPAQDVTAFSKVAFTIRHGKIIFSKP